MQQAPSVLSPSVCLDLSNECLWRGPQVLPLRPKTFAVLRLLVEHPGQLVSKATLLAAVWSETVVGDGVLMVCIRELRHALGDDARAPRFIETVHRRGYRWIGTLAVTHGSGHTAQALLPPPHMSPLVAPTTLGAVRAVRREAEVEQLHRWLDKVLTGVRQVVFVTGEAGLGKTTVIATFLETLRGAAALWIGRGQCIEHYGVGEAYLPVLEALGRLCREPGGAGLVALLAQRAPTWLLQMPGLLSPADLRTLRQRVGGATRERMLREMAEAVEVFTAVQPLVLVLEDLHWSDYATLDLLATLARRPEPARLLVLGTYRPAEVTMRDHPLHAVHHELHVHGLCAALLLTGLSEAALATYLATRFPGAQLPTWLARFVHQRTEGHPLFMRTLVEDWVAQGWLLEADGQWTLRAALPALQASMPESLRQMLAMQLDRLSPEEQQVLEVGSVVGSEFSAAAVAAGFGDDVMRIDERCAALARRSQLVHPRGEQTWPDGTVAGCYGFVHALYQEMLYSRLTAARRVSLHRQIGLRAEVGYGAQAGEIAAELAMHFERGRDAQRAVAYLHQAADNARRRSAEREAITHLTKGLALLQTLPQTPERTQQELVLQSTLGASLATVQGYAAPEVERAYARAHALCQHVGTTPQLFPVLWGLLQFSLVRAQLQTARQLGEQLLTLAQSAQDPMLLLAASNGLGTTLTHLGDFLPARAYLEQSIALYEPHMHQASACWYSIDLGVDSRAHLAHVLWLLGYPEQARRRAHEVSTLAQALLHPFSLAHACNLIAVIHQLCGEAALAQARAEAGLALAHEQGMVMELGRGTMLRGWALVAQGQAEEGLDQMRQGLATYRATAAEVWWPYYAALLAEGYGQSGQMVEGLRLLAEALAMTDHSEEHWWNAELQRRKGEFLLVPNASRLTVMEAEHCFQHALRIARCQQAKSLELRAAMSLSRLWQQQGKRDAARALLAPIYGWFTEGFDTADLQEAKALLEG